MLPAGTSLQAIRAGLRRKRRLQDLITGKKRHRQNKMHSRMRVTVLLQRNLLVRSGTTPSLIALKFSHFFLNIYVKYFKFERLIAARRRWDRREIELFQGLFHAAQCSPAKITKTCHHEKKPEKETPSTAEATAKGGEHGFQAKDAPHKSCPTSSRIIIINNNMTIFNTHYPAGAFRARRAIKLFSIHNKLWIHYISGSRWNARVKQLSRDGLNSSMIDLFLLFVRTYLTC